MGLATRVLVLHALVVGTACDNSNPFDLWTSVEAYPFVRLLDKDGKIGSSSKFRGESHALAPALTSTQLTSFLHSPPSGHFALALNASLLTAEVWQELEASNHVGAVLVLAGKQGVNGFSPVQAYPNKQQGTHPSSTHVWNSAATSLRFASPSFPVIALNAHDTREVVQRALENLEDDYSYPREAIMIDTFMHAGEDTTVCLRRDMCAPMGGQSVWSAVPPLTADDGRPVVMMTAEADADSMFYRLAPGANSVTSGAIAVMAAMAAVANVPEAYTGTSRIVAALFTAEAFGKIGSRAFVDDLKNFKCEKGDAVDHPGKSCDEPYRADTTFSFLPLSAITHVIEASMLAGNNVSANASFVLHPHSNEASDSLATTLGTTAASLGDSTARSTVSGLPPAVSETFVLASSSAAAVVVADFDDHFTDQFYQSRLDTDVSNATRVCRAAEVMARTALSLAANYSAQQPALVNCSLVEALVDCFTRDLTCQLLQDYGFPDDLTGTTWADDEGVANQYTSVYRMRAQSPIPTVAFAKGFFQRVASGPGDLPACNSNSDCASGSDCIAGGCSNGTSKFHTAVSLAFEYDYASSRFKLKSNTADHSTLTESNWRGFSIQLHQQDDVLTDVGFLAVGVALTVATAALVHAVRRHYQSFLYGVR